MANKTYFVKKDGEIIKELKSLSAAKKIALQFIETTIQSAYKNGAQYEDVVEKVRDFIAANAGSCAGLTIDSPEVQNLLNEAPF